MPIHIRKADMTKKQTLRSEIERLRRHNQQLLAEKTLRRALCEIEFEEGLQSIHNSTDRSVRVILPNGTIIPATVKDLEIVQAEANVGTFTGPHRTMSGLRSVSMTLLPQPNK